MTRTRAGLLGMVAALTLAAAPTGATKAPENAKVYFINLHDGIEVTSPFRVLIGLRNMGIAPANLDKFGPTGHHHLLVNVPVPPAGEPIPDDKGKRKRYIHMGGGQTETVVDLPNGTHELQLIMGDYEHVPHAPMVTSKRITVKVTGQQESVCQPLLSGPSSCKAGGE